MAKRPNAERSGESVFMDIERLAADTAERRLSECRVCSQPLPERNDVIGRKCANCGAWNQDPTISKIADVLMAAISQPMVRRVWSFAMVMFVMGIMQSITISGVVYIYPYFLPPSTDVSFYLHWWLCFCLWANTTWNYAEAVLRDPGFVELNGSQTMQLEGPRFCQRCQQGKPLGSHHCRICRRCVHNMDHHCPFIGNCVGRGNRRSFVLFLFWSASSLAYVLIITAIHCYDRSEDIIMNVRAATEHLPQLKLETMPLYLHGLVNHTYVDVHLHAVGFLLLLGSVTFLMTFGLFISQVRLICDGQTTVGRLQARQLARRQMLDKGLKEQMKVEKVHAKSADTWVQNCQDVFGAGPWWSVLLPQFYLFNFPGRAAKKV